MNRMLERVSTGDNLWLAGGHIADVRTGTLRRADIAIAGDRISAVVGRDGQPMGPVIDVTGRILVPGYIEPHTHFSIVNPAEFAGVLLRHGTTTAVVDALPLMLLARPVRLPDLLGRLSALPL